MKRDIFHVTLITYKSIIPSSAHMKNSEYALLLGRTRQLWGGGMLVPTVQLLMGFSRAILTKGNFFFPCSLQNLLPALDVTPLYTSALYVLLQ